MERRPIAADDSGMEPKPILADDRKAVYSVDMAASEQDGAIVKTWRDIPSIRRVYVDLNSADAFADTIRSAQEAIQAGHNPQPTTSGSSGSYLVPSTQSTITGIFKPRDEEPYADLNPRWTKWLHRTMSPCCFGRACLMPNGGYLSEVAASFVDRWAGLEMVPRTEIAQLASPSFSYRRGQQIRAKVGSFQLFVHDFKPYSEVAPIINMLCAQSASFQSAFQLELERLVCLDYVIRNTDRTFDNWMVRVLWVRECDNVVFDGLVPDGGQPLEQCRPIVKIAAIDHGLAFPWRHPDGLCKYPYSWQSLPQSLVPFSAQLRTHLLGILDDPQQWQHLCLQYAAIVTGSDPSCISFLPRQLSIIRGQLWSLKWCLQTKHSTPADLVSMARLRVEEDGEHFWKRYGWRKDKAGFREQHAMGRRWWVKEEPVGCCFPSCW